MAAAKKVPTRKYVVVKKHTLGHSVGDVIEVTPSQARHLIGKIRSLSDVEKDAKAGNELKVLAEENASLKEQLEAAVAELAELKKGK